MQQNEFQRLTASSKNALAWAYTRARHRPRSERATVVSEAVVSEAVAPDLVSTLDLLVGVLLAHPSDSEPHQLFEHLDLRPDALYDALRKQGGFAPDDAPDSPEHLDQMPPLDTDAEDVLDESFMLSEKLNPETDHLVRLRDVFGGMLRVPNQARDLLQGFLSPAGLPFEELMGAYSEFLGYPSEKMSLRAYLAQQFPFHRPAGRDKAEVSPAIRLAVSGFSSDTRTERDLIGIGAEVDAFAYLLAAKALQPPMAIGLFGDWGSGKSFFMEALRRRIHKITADARESGQPQGKISIYKYIAQIEFNAWHYVEGELWASLVEHIFRNLKTRSEEEPPLLQERQQLVVERLELARRAQQAAQGRMAGLESQLAVTQARVAALEKEREAALKELNELKAADILEAVQLSPEDRDDIGRTLRELGVTEVANTPAELMRGADELRTVLQRGNALTTPLRERGWKWAVALIFVTLIGPAISLALSRIGDVPSVTNALVSVAAFLSGLTVMVKQGTAWLSGALARVEGAQLRLDAKRRGVEGEFAIRIAEAERQYDEKATEYDQAKNEEREREREIAELEDELRRITPGRVLLDFINERVGSQDYRKHLGIAALIRSDFEQLSQLIADENKEFGERDDGIVREEDRHLINRIILYIDDLDRCPPDRVVQVLQAVHLLLAFPLFVVIVAVDARWLSQSLQAQYQNLLATSTLRNGLELSEGFGRQASPQDYLEKIFQIPFWVRPLPEKARMRIVTGLVAKSLVPSSAATGNGGERRPSIEQMGASDKTVAGVEGERATVQWEASERRRPLDLDAETDLKPEGLDIQPVELQFMDGLRSLLGQTPRSVKRFVNVYRLIKAFSLDQPATFVEDKPEADYKLVLFLLAVLTGLPAISREFFRQLRGERTEIEQAQGADQQPPVPTGRTLAQVLEAIRDAASAAPTTSPSGPALSGQDATATLDLARDGHISGQGYGDWHTLRDLERLETWLKKHEGGSWLQFDATALADWAPQVVRFSYRMEEL